MECDTFELNSMFFPRYPPPPTNSCFASLKAISDKGLQTILNLSVNYWFQYCDVTEFW